jgi:hypothetical protein
MGRAVKRREFSSVWFSGDGVLSVLEVLRYAAAPLVQTLLRSVCERVRRNADAYGFVC